jgi:hypothetical protein
LPQKQVRRVKRRKVVQDRVKWKGYPEENTWADEVDIQRSKILTTFDSDSGQLAPSGWIVILE